MDDCEVKCEICGQPAAAWRGGIDGREFSHGRCNAHLLQETPQPTAPADVVEAMARAIMLDDGCGYMGYDGQRVFCDDPSIEAKIRMVHCGCKSFAAVAYQAALPLIVAQRELPEPTDTPMHSIDVEAAQRFLGRYSEAGWFDHNDAHFLRSLLEWHRKAIMAERHTEPCGITGKDCPYG